jgi:hypothetical protein
MNFDKKVSALLEMAGEARHFGKTKRVSELSSEEERVNAVKSINDNIKKLKQNIKTNPDDSENLKIVFDIYDLVINNLAGREGYNVGTEFKTKEQIFQDLLNITIVPEKLYKDGKVESWHDYREMHTSKGRTIDNLKKSGFSTQPIRVTLTGKPITITWYYMYEELIRHILNKRLDITSMVTPRNRKEKIAEGGTVEEVVYYFARNGQPQRTYINVPTADDGIIHRAFWKSNRIKVVGPHPTDPNKMAICSRKIKGPERPVWYKKDGSQGGYAKDGEINFYEEYGNNSTIDTVRKAVRHDAAKIAYQKKYPPNKFPSLYRSGRPTREDCPDPQADWINQ